MYGIFTYIYHKNQPFMYANIPYLDGQGFIKPSSQGRMLPVQLQVNGVVPGGTHFTRELFQRSIGVEVFVSFEGGLGKFEGALKEMSCSVGFCFVLLDVVDSLHN